MAKTQVDSAGRYAHIDAIRALSVMIVVVAHAGLGAIVPGGAGVTVFFAISGFIITHLILREKEATGRFDIRGFYLRRAFKIVPPFVVAILLPTILFGISGGQLTWSHVVAQIFFVSNWLYAYDVPEMILPGSRIVWSLSIEEQFYIIFAIVWVIVVARRRWHKVLTLIVVAAIVVPIVLRTWFFLAVGSAAGERVYAGTDTRIDAIAIGMLAAILYRRYRVGRLPTIVIRILESPCVVPIAAILFAGTLLYRDEWFQMIPMYTLQATIAAAVVLNGLLLREGQFAAFYSRTIAWQPIQSIGLASYSIYLVHAPLFAFLEPIGERLPRPIQIVSFVVVGTIAGLLLWQFIEKPVERLKRRSVTRRLSRTEAKE